MLLYMEVGRKDRSRKKSTYRVLPLDDWFMSIVKQCADVSHSELTPSQTFLGWGRRCHRCHINNIITFSSFCYNQGNICVYRTVSLCWNVARGSRRQAPVPMTPIRLLNSAWEKARPCRYAGLHHSPVTFLPHAGLNCIYSPHISVFRSTLCPVPTLSWLWSIPRVEDGKGSGEYLWESKKRERAWQLMAGDRRANGCFRTYPNWIIIIVLVLVIAQTYTHIYWLSILKEHIMYFSVWEHLILDTLSSYQNLYYMF